MKYLFPVLICALFFASCFSEGDCLITATNELRIQFKRKSNKSLDTAVNLTQVAFKTSDSVMVFKVATSDILIPMDISTDSTTIYFTRINADSTKSITDTLKINYKRQTQVITKDCGAYTSFQNLNLIHSDTTTQIRVIDTSLIKDPTGSAKSISSYAINFQILY